jgi:tRNA(Ile)-lysidine synthase
MYIEENSLEPKHDKTNDENIYTRNKIRNVLIPLIQEEFNPNIIETLDRLSKLLALENDYLEKETEKSFDELVIKDEKQEIILNLREFNKEHKAIKSRLIILCIKKLLKDTNGIGKIHIDDIIKLCENNVGNKYLTPNKRIKVGVGKGKICFFVTKKT